jgi:hypothetical protein
MRIRTQEFDPLLRKKFKKILSKFDQNEVENIGDIVLSQC